MTTPGNVPGIYPEDLHKLRYQCVVNREGKRILIQVFEWSFKGGVLSVREALFLDPAFTNGRYRSIFNAHQRTKLDAEEPITTFDITLLYLVLRRVCDLAPDDESWITENPYEPTLENLIYKVKLHRNNLAHEDFCMTQSEMEDKLDELRLLFSDIIKKAGVRFSKPADEVTNIITDINERIDQVYKKIREPLGSDDVEQYQQDIQELRAQLENDIKSAAKMELDKLYCGLYEINLLPWFLVDFQVNPTLIFTKFSLKEDGGFTDQKPQTIPHDAILEVKRTDDSSADVLIVSGEGGMGKTTFLKYMLEKWVKAPSSVPGLDQVELLFYMECRNPCISSFTQLTQSLLHETHREVSVEFELVRETVLHMQILILIDGFDEVNDASKQVIRELLHLPASNVRIIFTTRPGSLSFLCSLLPHHRRKLILVIEGITKELHMEFVGRLCDSFLSDEEQRTKTKMVLNEHLEKMIEYLGTHLNSPLNLTLFTMLFIQNPNVIGSLTTATDLYILLTKLIIEKLTERVVLKCSDPDIEYKISQFVEFYDSLSFRAMKRREYELLPDTIQSFQNKCHELCLPFDELMAAFFTAKRSRPTSFFNILTYSYHHLRLQEFSVARHLHRCITQTMDLETPVNQFLAETDEWISEERFQNVLIHLTGLLTSHQDLLCKYSSKLLSIVNIRSTCVDPILSHVIEAKFHLDMIKAAVAKLSEHGAKWDGWVQIKQSSSLSALATVLDAMPTTFNVMALTAFSRCSTDVHLKSAFRALAKKEIRLVLDLYNFYFGNGGNALTKETFHLLLQKDKPLILEGFRGRLSTAALSLVPSCLKELRLRVNFKEICLLSRLIPRLEKLEILGLKYDDEKRHTPEEFHPVPFKGRKLNLTIAPAFGNSEDDVEWVGGILAKLCSLRPNGNCTCIFLMEGDLRRDGVERLLEILHAKGVTVSRRFDLQLKKRLGESERKKLADLCLTLNLGSFIVHMARGL